MVLPRLDRRLQRDALTSTVQAVMGESDQLGWQMLIYSLVRGIIIVAMEPFHMPQTTGRMIIQQALDGVN